MDRRRLRRCRPPPRTPPSPARPWCATKARWAATVWGATVTPILYLLTDHVGVPFEQDGMRDGEHLRGWMTDRFVRGLVDRGMPWTMGTGTPPGRLIQAIHSCAAIRDRFTFADPLTPS